MGIMASLLCEPAPVVPHDSLVFPLDIHCQRVWLSMCWWAVVQLSVSIVNMGLWGRIPACVWVIGLAICGDKQMATLATLWKANIEVCFVHQQLFRRRSGGVPAMCLNTH